MTDALDKIKAILNQGPRNWNERLNPTLTLISPNGDEYTSKWRGDSQTKDKKLGIFFYPKIKGNTVQDLSINSDRFSITFWLEGLDNDLQARRFYASCSQDGTWTLNHPMEGPLELQLISVTKNNQPIESGGITEINTEWIEPIDPATLVTARELAGIIDGQSDVLNVSAAQQFANQLNESSEKLRSVINNTTTGISNLTAFALGPLFTATDALDNSINAIQDGIQDTLNATVLQAESLAGQIQALVQLPVLGTSDVISRLDSYDDLVDEYIALLPLNSTQSAKNETLCQELALSACLVSLAQTITTGTLKTRQQAVGAAQLIIAIFNRMLAALEAVQDTFSTEDIDNQYWAMTDGISEASILVSQAVRYLLVSSFDLKVERRFILEEPAAPIAIAAREYGGFGENDSNYDLFIESNDLHGNDILWLPSGREVVIYV
ncbi:DNA circularization N-terminal domain-containing protein [Candidatus Pacearchaeota archaeon]|nr:DNA circularization N-terminal domain-containing protein [Candidatus Pacearchaeota archaeon]